MAGGTAAHLGPNSLTAGMLIAGTEKLHLLKELSVLLSLQCSLHFAFVFALGHLLLQSWPCSHLEFQEGQGLMGKHLQTKVETTHEATMTFF
jgi:hypothetical protein